MDVYISKCYRKQENLNFFGFGGECEKVGEDVVGALVGFALAVAPHARGLLTRYRICIYDDSTSGHHGFSEVNTRDLNGERKREKSRVPSYVLSRGRQINSHTGTFRTPTVCYRPTTTI